MHVHVLVLYEELCLHFVYNVLLIELCIIWELT